MKIPHLPISKSIAKLLLISILVSGCAYQSKLTKAEQVQLNQHNELVSDIEQFVQTTMFESIIQVRQAKRLAWNKLLSIYTCGSKSTDQQVPVLLASMQIDFQASIRATAAQLQVFVMENEKAILNDISQTAFRLFSATYAKGYARQIRLADEIQSGIRNDFCGGQVNPIPPDLSAFSKTLIWKAEGKFNASTNQSLTAYLNQGIGVFEKKIQQQSSLFEALVYSHAYQRNEEYQMLFFEVNKFENVENYASKVNTSAQHSEFAYLVLSSGYHWGMMSVLAILEQDFTELHDAKRQVSEALVDAIVVGIEQTS